MADGTIRLPEISAGSVSTPTTGKVLVYVDDADKHIKTIDDTGTIRDLTLEGGSGFYGITAKHSDDSVSFTGLDVLSFDSFNFYLTQNLGNTDEVQIQLRNLPGAAGGEVNTGSSLGGDADVFKQKIGFDLKFRGLSEGFGIDLTENANDITITSTAGPGFYGVIFKETESGGALFRDDQLNVDSDFFYLSSDGSGKPILSSTGGAGEANTASNLPGDEGVFFQKSGVDLEFKSLTAGTNITLSSDNDAITINSTGGGGGGGFYGIVVKDDSTAVVTDSILFPSADFDVDSFGDGARVQLDATVARQSDLPPAFYGVIVSESGPANTQPPDDTIRFEATDFVVSNGADSKPLVSLESDVARTADIPPAFYGIVVKDDSTAVVTDSIEFSGSDFDVAASGDGALVSLDATVAKISDLPAGFYGVIFKETDANPAVFQSDVLKVDSDFFYLSASSGEPQQPILSIKNIFEPVVVAPGALAIEVKNRSGGTVFPGDVLTHTGSIAGNKVEVTLAQSNSDTTMPAIGVALEIITNNANGLMLIEGIVEKVNFTNIGIGAPNVGDELWVDPSTAGDVTETRPTHPNIPQTIGIITDDNVNNGKVFVRPGTLFNLDDGSLQATFTIGTTTASSVIIDPSGVTAQRTATIQDKSGTVAYLDDIGPGFYGVVVKDGTTTVVTDSIEFQGADFDVSASGDGALVALESDVARLSDIPPGFYGIVVKDDVTTVVTDSIEFQGSDFDVSASGDGSLVTLDANVAKLSDLPPGFYGVIFKETESGGAVFRDDQLNVDSEFFYLSSDGSGKPVLSSTGVGEVNTASNLGAGEGNVFSQKVGVDLQFKSLVQGTNVTITEDANEITINSTGGGGGGGFYGIVVKDDSTAVTTDSILFPSADFDVDSFEDGARVQLDATVARVSDIGPGFYGMVFKHSDDSTSFSGIKVAAFDNSFYLTQNAPNTDEVIVNLRGGGPTGPQGPEGPQGDPGADGAGFYGIIVGETDESPVFDGIEAIKFNSRSFYVTQNAPNTDEAIVNFRGDPNAEANTASNLGAGQGNVFAQKAGVDLQFKSLVQGTNVTISETSTEVTINSTGGGGGGGFYGVIFKESEAGGAVFRDDTLVVDSNFFYLSSDGSDKPILSSTGVGEVNTASNLAGDEGVFAQKSGVDLEFKSLTAGNNITLSSDANAITITTPDPPPGFYGIVVKDGTTTVVTDSIEFQGADFDVSASGDGALVALEADVARTSDIPPGFYGVIVSESGPANVQPPDDTIRFEANDFVVSNGADSKPLVSLETDVARTSDIPPGFYGIVVKDDVTTVVTDSIDFSGTDFDVSASGDGALVELDATVAKLSDIPPGFYGIIVRDGNNVYKTDTLNFAGIQFYLSGDLQGDPVANLQPDQTFDTVTIDEYIDFNEDLSAPPPSPTNAIRVYADVNQTVIELNSIFPDGEVHEVFRDSLHTVRNTSGSGMSQGDLVYITGASGNIPTISLADSSSATTMPAYGFVASPSIADNAFGRVILIGDISGVDTTGMAAGDVVYTSPTTPGAITNTRPTYPDIQQIVGTVETVGASGIVVANVQRSSTFIEQLTDGTNVYNNQRQLNFNENDFYLSGDVDGEPVVNLKDVARTSDIPPGFYGIVVKDDVTTVVTDSIEFQGADFDVTASGDGALVALDATVAKLSDLPPGFYGVIFKETESGGALFRDDQLNVDSEFFYLSSDGSGKPILSSTGVGEVNTASNLGAGQGNVFAQKVAEDLQFKSLVQGTNVTISETATEITINSTASGGGGGGFYGVIFKETEAGGAVFRDDQLNVDSSFFYLSSDGSAKPVLSLHSAPQEKQFFYLNDVLDVNAPAPADGNFLQYDDGTGLWVPAASGATITVSDGVNTHTTSELNFSGADFYLSTDLGGDPVVNLLNPNTGLKTQSFASSVEWQFTHNLNFKPVLWNAFDGVDEALIPAKVDVSNPNIAYFYFNTAVDGTAIVTGSVAQQDGESNTASNLAGDEGIFFQKTGVDLEFKSLTAGTSITLSSDNDAITINSTATGGGGSGFYGIVVKHSDDSESFSGINVVSVNVDSFYLTQNTTNTDEVLINLRNEPDLITTSLTLEDPRKDDNISMFFTRKDITAVDSYGVLIGPGHSGTPPHVEFDVRHDPNRNVMGKTVFSSPQTLNSTTVGQDFNPDGDITIPANSHVWFYVVTTSFYVSQLNFNFDYTED